jgi:hypothetical protein
MEIIILGGEYPIKSELYIVPPEKLNTSLF